MIRDKRPLLSLFLLVAVLLGSASAPAAQDAAVKPSLEAERALAATVSETRMVEAVRRLVGFGTRMYGTPSNHAAAAWLAAAFKEAGLEVQVREDSPRDWYQPVTWEVRTTGGAPGSTPAVLATTWPSSGSPTSAGEGVLSIDASPGAVCLVSANPTPETTTGCAAVLFDGRVSASGWPGVGRLRGSWTIPVFSVSPRESTPLRARVSAGEKIRVAFTLEASRGNAPAHTVVATLPGRDRSKYILFCAHGDSDSGGPGANDNASGVAIVLEIARAAAAAVKSGALKQPAWDLRFASWGGEISSTRQYVAAMDKDASRLQAVFNYDQSGFGSSKDALYVEPDDVAANKELITLVRDVMAGHIARPGFPERAASVKSQGGTDSYVFQPRAADATVYPSVTLYTSAWDRERSLPVTEGFPPINWYPDEKPGMVTVDGDAFYHSVGDTPANTTDTEPSNMGWCARVGLLSAVRVMGDQIAPAEADPPVSMVMPGGEAMKYWSRWRGPSGQGLVEGTGYPDTWSDTDNVIWKVPVPGRGHSSPIIWADRIFLTTAAADGSSRSVLCFRRSDGKLLWERAVPEAPAESLYPKNSYASSSVSTDGTLVYAYFGNAGVVAVDFSGKIVWHVGFGPITLYHGPGGSPLLYKDRLILFQEQRLMSRTATTDPGFMVALDAKTGKELWRQTRTPQPGWGTPIAITAGARDEIIVSSSRRIEAFDPATGGLLWFSTGNTFEVIPTPVVGLGLVFCSSGRAGPTFAVRPGGSGDVTSSRVVWSTPKGSSFVPSPLLLGDYLYTVNDMAAIVSAHHARTGELVGQLRLGEAKREGFSASPVAVEGKIYFTNDDGETFVLSQAPDFKLLHVNRLSEQTLASPALVDGRWYIRTAGHLLAIGRR